MQVTLGTNPVSTTPGTAVVLSATQILATTVLVQALDNNAGVVRVGGPNTLVTTRKGIALSPGESYLFPGKSTPHDLSLIYLDVTNSGEGVTVTYDVWGSIV